MSSYHRSDIEGEGESKLGIARLWVLRGCAAVLIPGLILGVAFGVLEFGLRLAGVGNPTSFYLSQSLNGQSYLEANDRFTFRFFPRALARNIVPHRLEVPKSPDTFRIFLFGESAANGDPDPAYGFGRQLEVFLNERFPDTRFEVVCVAITAINSHVVLPIAREVAGIEADLWIIYMGNNEVIGPFGAGTVFGQQAPPMPLIRASLAVRKTRTGQAFEGLLGRIAGGAETPDNWEGINLFADHLLHPSDPNRARVYRHFERNLDDILAAAERAGVPVLLGTVASNLRDCAPFASLHAPHLPDSEMLLWEESFALGRELEAEGSHAEALVHYYAAATLDGHHAELLFHIARCYDRLGNMDAAARAYSAARDADALVVRADSKVNDIIRKAVLNGGDPGVHLVDTVEQLAKLSTDGIPGHHYFFEHVHFNPVGNAVVAQIYAEAVMQILPDAIRSAATAEWTNPATPQRQLALTLWDQHRLWVEMAARQSRPPFSNRLNNAEAIAWCEMRSDRLAEHKDHPLNRVIYEQALELRPEDYFLNARFGAFLQMNGLVEEALPFLRQAADAFPDFVGGQQDLGVALLILGRYAEARERFERVLEINPDYPRAHTALALIREQDL